jgi:hypothetical protein
MIDVDELPDQVREDILQNRGTEDLEIFKTMTPNQAFVFWCEWQGIIGWSHTIRNALDAIRKAEIKKQPGSDDTIQIALLTLACRDNKVNEHGFAAVQDWLDEHKPETDEDFIELIGIYEAARVDSAATTV